MKQFTKDCDECYGNGTVIVGVGDAWGVDADEVKCFKCDRKGKLTYELPF